MFICKMYAITTGNKYPDVTCSEIKDIYTEQIEWADNDSDYTTIVSNTSYEAYAYREYVGYYMPSEFTFAAKEGQ